MPPPPPPRTGSQFSPAEDLLRSTNWRTETFEKKEVSGDHKEHPQRSTTQTRPDMNNVCLMNVSSRISLESTVSKIRLSIIRSIQIADKAGKARKAKDESADLIKAFANSVNNGVKAKAFRFPLRQINPALRLRKRCEKSLVSLSRCQRLR